MTHKHNVVDSRMVCEDEECPFDESSVASRLAERVRSMRDECRRSYEHLGERDQRAWVWKQAAAMCDTVLLSAPEEMR